MLNINKTGVSFLSNWWLKKCDFENCWMNYSLVLFQLVKCFNIINITVLNTPAIFKRLSLIKVTKFTTHNYKLNASGIKHRLSPMKIIKCLLNLFFYLFFRYDQMLWWFRSHTFTLKLVKIFWNFIWSLKIYNLYLWHSVRRHRQN